MMDQTQVIAEVESLLAKARREMKLLLDSREKSQILVKLDEAQMWLDRLEDKYED